MTIYLFLILIIVTSYLLDKYAKKRSSGFDESVLLKVGLKDILVIWTISTPLVLLVTFRSPETGVDTIQYINLYSYGPDYFQSRIENSGEYLFWSIYRLCYEISDGSFGLRLSFYICAEAAALIGLAAVYKLSSRVNCGIACLIYLLIYYQEYFNIIRQIPAISLIFLSYCYVIEKKPLKYLVCIVLAVGFHLSSFAALIVYPIAIVTKKKNLGILSYTMLCSILIVAVFFSPALFDWAVGHTGASKYADYTLDSSWSQGGWMGNFLLFLPIALILLFAYKNVESIEASYCKNELHWLTIVTMLFYALLIARMYTNWAFRLGYYYELGLIMLSTQFCSDVRFVKQSLSNSRFGLNTLLIVTYYIVYFLYLNCINNFDTSALTNYSFSIQII